VNPPAAFRRLPSQHEPLRQPHARAANQTDRSKTRSTRKNPEHPKVDRPAE
jgi:hypothetical protein